MKSGSSFGFSQNLLKFFEAEDTLSFLGKGLNKYLGSGEAAKCGQKKIEQFLRSTEGATCWLGIVMRIYEERRRCEMFGRENLTSFCGAPKVRNVWERKFDEFLWSGEGAKCLVEKI